MCFSPPGLGGIVIVVVRKRKEKEKEKEREEKELFHHKVTFPVDYRGIKTAFDILTDTSWLFAIVNQLVVKLIQ